MNPHPDAIALARKTTADLDKHGHWMPSKTRYCPSCGKQRTAATQFSSNKATVCKRCAG